METELFEVDGLCVDVQYLVLGPLFTNVYIISDGTGTFVVDPADSPDVIMQALGDRKLDAIILTHYHNDHTGALRALRDRTGARVIASAIDAPSIEDPSPLGITMVSDPCPVDERVENGDIITIGSMEWKVVNTPGHTPGSICLYLIPQFGNHADGRPVLISGDTLFAGNVGRTDFPGGSLLEMRDSIKRLARLPDDVVVLPGHEDLTTIRAERRRVFALFGLEPESEN